MKKFLKLCATFTLVGALFVGCIDNTEPDGVRAIREAKARLLDAHKELVAANATLILAKAELERANAELQKSLAAINTQTAEAQKIKNDYERGVLQAKIAAGIAEYNAFAQEQLARQWEAQANAAIHEKEYLLALVEMQRALAFQKIEALDQVVAKIWDLMLEQAIRRNDRLVLLAQLYFYETVEIPYVERRLVHDLEYARVQLEYSKNMYDIWTDIKNLAIEEYVKYAEEMLPKMKEIELKEVELRANIANEQFKLEELRSVEKLAEFAYLYSGVNTDLTNISIPNVFSSNATDMFRAVNVDKGNNQSNNVITGVYDNTYSFYHTISHIQGVFPYPPGTKANLGYKSTLEQLKADYNIVKDGRYYGPEGGSLLTDATLNARLARMNSEINDYKNQNTNWRNNYDNARDRSTWSTARSDFMSAVATYNATWGVSSGYYADPAGGTNANYTAAQLSHAQFLAAMEITDVNLRREALAALPVNFLYFMQKQLIGTYVSLIKAMISGQEIPGGLLDGSTVPLSDILGGITFNPKSLFQLVVGQNNAQTFATLINLIMGVSYAVDLVNMITDIMPVYYQKTSSFLGPIYGQGPIFEKYNVSSAWEYHAWFLIYILFENNKMVVGNNILTINAKNYDNAIWQLWEDFLGCRADADDYPGNYDYTLGSPVSNGDNSTLTLNHRLAVNNLVFSHPNPTNSNMPNAANVLNKEIDLRTAWYNWGSALRNLNTAERNLYYPWHRIWTVSRENSSGVTQDFHFGYVDYTTTHGGFPTAVVAAGGTPRWIYENPTGTSTGSVGDLRVTPFNENFYFQHELVPDDDYPSLEDGVDIYWANLADPWINFADPHGIVYNPDITGANFSNRIQLSYYPAIAAKQSRLVFVNWNQWLNIGLPAYIYDPILWCNNFNDPNNNPSWENNGWDPNILISRVARAFASIRNYEQFKFWVDQKDNYISLGEQIAEKITPLEIKVNELYQDYMDAVAARVLKEYEIEALNGEAGLCHTAYIFMERAYQGLRSEVLYHFWDEGGVGRDGYDFWFNAYTDALKNYEWHLANYEVFMANETRYVYYSTEFDAYVKNMRIEIQGKIDAIDQRLMFIENELAILESTRQAILDVL